MIAKDSLLKYGNMLAQGDIRFTGTPTILVQEDKETYLLNCISNNELNDNSIENYSGASDILKAVLIRSGYNAMIICKPEWAGRAIDNNIELFPTLDDMAMIVGPKLSIVNKDIKEIEKALKASSAVMLRDDQLICLGRTIYEAYTCLTVLEKNAKIYFKAQVLGGAKYVNLGSAVLEHNVYKKKYSKNERRTQNAAEGRE